MVFSTIIYIEVVRMKALHRQGKFDKLLNHKIEPFLSCWTPNKDLPAKGWGRVNDGAALMA